VKSGYPIVRTEAHRPISSMLFQSIIGVSLETLEDFCIGSFKLTIALWMSNRCIANEDAKIFAISLEGAIGKLGPVASYHSIRDPKPIDDRLDELDCPLLADLDHRGHFRLLIEFVDGDIEVPVPSDGLGERP
jgi:hypothetical protein